MKKILLIASVPVALMLFFAAAEVWKVKFVHRFDEDRRINFDVTKLR